MSQPPPFNAADLLPESTPDYMLPAWVSAVHWCAKNPEFVRAFQAKTGLTYVPPQTAIDRMIDEACGTDRAYLEAFIRWFNEHVWGEVRDVVELRDGGPTR